MTPLAVAPYSLLVPFFAITGVVFIGLAILINYFYRRQKKKETLKDKDGEMNEDEEHLLPKD